MSCTVYNLRKGTERDVKNLGWLVRHLGTDTVELVDVRTIDDGSACLFVEFAHDIMFSAYFASAEVLRAWLDARRNLKGVPLRWDGEDKGVI